MLNTLLKIFSWISSIWGSLPEETKKKIIDGIAESFEEVFKDFYKSQQESGEPDVNP